MKLYEISMEFYKVFYVEAESEEAALEHSQVDEESSSRFGDVDMEFDGASASVVADNMVTRIKERSGKIVFPADKE